MPGTIIVSVLDLVDIPQLQSSSIEGTDSGCFSFKVAIGKREYKTKGREDLSLPVLSLRENLVITLQDTEGNEVSRTDVKTMLVVEKGLWDAWFPLEGGGCAHLKLQFSISEEERNRIREMRETALKRKITNLPNNEEISDGSTPKTATELQKEVSLNNRKQQTAPEASSNLPVQEDQKYSENFPDKNTVTTQLPLDNACPINESSTEGSDPEVGFLGSVISGNVSKSYISTLPKSKEDGGSSPKWKDELGENPVSNVKKMIGAFESGLSQEKRLRSHTEPMTKSQIRKIESGGSWTWLGKAKTNKVEAGETIVKSFSTGNLSEMKLEQSPDYLNLQYKKDRKEKVDYGPPFRRESSGENKANIELGDIQNLKNDNPAKAAKLDSFIYATLSTIYDRTSDAPEPVKVQQMVNVGGSEENAGSCSFPSYQHQSAPDIVRFENVYKIRRDDLRESSACGTSNQMLDIVIDACLFGYPGIWVRRQRHVCITTGTKQLMDLIEGCQVPIGIYSVEKDLIAMSADKEHSNHGGLNNDAITGENVSCFSEKPNPENSRSNPWSHRRLIEQAARILILAVACGTLVLNTRVR